MMAEGWASSSFAWGTRQAREVTVEEVRVEGTAIYDATAQQQADPLFMIPAVTQNGLVLEWASPDLRRNKAVVLPAVKDCGASLTFADLSMRMDQEVVRAALKTCPAALLYAADPLWDDDDFVAAARKANPWMTNRILQNRPVPACHAVPDTWICRVLGLESLPERVFAGKRHAAGKQRAAGKRPVRGAPKWQRWHEAFEIDSDDEAQAQCAYEQGEEGEEGEESEEGEEGDGAGPLEVKEEPDVLDEAEAKEYGELRDHFLVRRPRKRAREHLRKGALQEPRLLEITGNPRRLRQAYRQLERLHAEGRLLEALEKLRAIKAFMFGRTTVPAFLRDADPGDLPSECIDLTGDSDDEGAPGGREVIDLETFIFSTVVLQAEVKPEAGPEERGA